MAGITQTHTSDFWRAYLAQGQVAAQAVEPWRMAGRLVKVAGLVMEAVGLKLPVGSGCQVVLPGGKFVEAEVVGFAGERLFLMPASDVYGLQPGALVYPTESLTSHAPRFATTQHGSPPVRPAQEHDRMIGVSEALLGRVIDGAGRPLDYRPLPPAAGYTPLYAKPYNPMEREPIKYVMDVGVRTINAMLTVGRGQRLGLFAGSGVGKSVLLGMMARYTTAEIVVVGLIGERGREVKEFIENILGEEGLKRSVVIAAPADSPPLLRLHGAALATAVAEYFRDQGKHVLLIMDSLTRYAMAQREIALAIGEPPATKGYPPSVFAKLPALVERAGNGPEGGGSITAFYTVLTEGDDQQDPIADSARAILDGHFVLSRQLAEAGHYPAIDVEASISRVMNELLTPEEWKVTRHFKQLYSRYQRSRDLISVGAYVKGNDPVLDEAMNLYPQMERFLQQTPWECTDYATSRSLLSGLFPYPIS